MDKTVETSGKTIDDAIQQGLMELNTTRDQVEVKILQIEAPRLFGLLGRRPAKVRLTSRRDFKSQALALTEEILSAMKSDADASAREFQGEIFIDINARGDKQFLIGPNGRTLDALQYLVSRIINDDIEGKERARIVIDIGGYRNSKEEDLRSLAERLAREAIEQNRETSTEPMAARERRVIHLTLKPNRSVETFSRGQGALRRVIISPAKPGGRPKRQGGNPKTQGGKPGKPGQPSGRPPRRRRRRRPRDH